MAGVTLELLQLQLRCQGKLESLEEDGPEDEPEDEPQLNALRLKVSSWTDSRPIPSLYTSFES